MSPQVHTDFAIYCCQIAISKVICFPQEVPTASPFHVTYEHLPVQLQICCIKWELLGFFFCLKPPHVVVSF